MQGIPSRTFYSKVRVDEDFRLKHALALGIGFEFTQMFTPADHQLELVAA
jgi:hypothetical protein